MTEMLYANFFPDQGTMPDKRNRSLREISAAGPPFRDTEQVSFNLPN
jgi:hypothetical protein